MGINNGDGRPISSVAWSSRHPLRTLSRIVSSGACSVASTVKSAASAASMIVQRETEDDHGKVHWAGFGELEINGSVSCRVLLLGHSSGFQVWDVNNADNVRKLVSRNDGPAFFLQLQPKPLLPNNIEDKFFDSRPLLVVCTADSNTASTEVHDIKSDCHNINKFNNCSTGNPLSLGGLVPSYVLFYSLKSLSYVHFLKFRSAVYSVRCSSRICAVAQSSQIHCFEATTLERKYTILTNPIASDPGSSSTGYGPLAVGCRWLAYSGRPVVLNSGCVHPHHFTPHHGSSGSASSGSLVAHYAKESSKQLAAGIATLGDIGYKKISKYCSDYLPDHHRSKSDSVSKATSVISNQSVDIEGVGMVIVRDVVSNAVISQFRAHKSPISALCFDPSGVLLVTASIQGHNINVFRITPNITGTCSSADAESSYTHLYQLQRGFTNAVIQDINFSSNGHWIMVSSSRGTSHLFAISISGESTILQPYESTINTKARRLNNTGRCSSLSPLRLFNQRHGFADSYPVTLVAVSRIRSGCGGWVGSGSDALAAAASRLSSPLGMTATYFQNCEGFGSFSTRFSQKNSSLFVFSPSGCIVQYELKLIDGVAGAITLGRYNFSEPESESGWKMVIEPIKKWNIWRKHYRKELEEDDDIYGENDCLDSHGIMGYFRGRTFVKENTIYEKKQHLFISEAEIQIQHAQSPLWTKPEIYFQAMIIENPEVVVDNSFGGEVDIEGIPTRMIEARLEDLVPVFDYAQSPAFHQSSCRLMHHMSEMIEPAGVSCGNFFNNNPEDGQTPSTLESSFPLKSELQNGMNKAQITIVNKHIGFDTYPQLGVVNSKDRFKEGIRFKVVNNSKVITEENLLEEEVVAESE